MYEYFGGVAKILVPDNCKTAVIHNKGWRDQRINAVYHELAEHYGTAIIPARVRKPKDKPNAEGSVGNISTWIVAALRNEQFFTIAELNAEIRKKLDQFNKRPFQKKRVADTNSSTTKNCHCWHRYPLPDMNWRNGNKPPFSSIITYPWTECYTQFRTNTLARRSMYG